MQLCEMVMSTKSVILFVSVWCRWFDL